jgi:hypothetical protein
MSAQAIGRINPYQSPPVCDSELPCCEVAANPAKPLRVAVLGGRLRRRAQLCGRISAQIEWNANNALEYVSVDGRKVVSKIAYFRSIPQFCFELQAGATTHRVTVDICIQWTFLIKAFRIVIDDEVVYCEGEAERLPILTGRPSSAR